MQSETADFALGAATWQTGRSIRIVFDSGPFAPLCKNNVIHKIGSTYHIALPSEKDRATATGNMYGKIGEIRSAILGICQQTDKETDKQTDMLTAMLHTPTAGRNNHQVPYTERVLKTGRF